MTPYPDTHGPVRGGVDNTPDPVSGERQPYSEQWARARAREYYWMVYDYDEYECPDCGRGVDRVHGFDVHHKDENPYNNHPSNLVGLCKRCHVWRHHTGPTIKGLDVDEWKGEFLAMGAGEI